MANLPDTDVLGDSMQSGFNVAATTNKIPNQKISAEILNQVGNNFRAYDDFMIFQTGLPPSMTPPLRRDQTTAPTDPHPFLSTLPPDPNQSQTDFGVGAKPRARDHQLAADIDQVMKQNFEYEQKTIETLFQRYQQYKPLVSGVYGQDVVQSVAHL